MEENWELVQLLALLVVIGMGIRAWAQSGFWIPRWVHIVALVMLVLGYVLWQLALARDYPRAEESFWLLVLGLPAGVYGVFFFYGGATGYVRHLGMLIEYHASMKKQDVREIFLRYVPQYLSMSMDEILRLGRTTPAVKLRKGTDRYYKLYARSERLAQEGPERELIALNLRLEDHSTPRRRPHSATTQILFRKDGTVVQDPLEFLDA